MVAVVIGGLLVFVILLTAGASFFIQTLQNDRMATAYEIQSAIMDREQAAERLHATINGTRDRKSVV